MAAVDPRLPTTTLPHRQRQDRGAISSRAASHGDTDPNPDASNLQHRWSSSCQGAVRKQPSTARTLNVVRRWPRRGWPAGEATHTRTGSQKPRPTEGRRPSWAAGSRSVVSDSRRSPSRSRSSPGAPLMGDGHMWRGRGPTGALLPLAGPRPTTTPGRCAAGFGRLGSVAHHRSLVNARARPAGCSLRRLTPIDCFGPLEVVPYAQERVPRWRTCALLRPYCPGARAYHVTVNPPCDMICTCSVHPRGGSSLASHREALKHVETDRRTRVACGRTTRRPSGVEWRRGRPGGGACR